jgi:single-strand selective monofunctional uracil DNA glycosylase
VTPKNITTELCERLDGLRFSEPVTHVYNPLVYARQSHNKYLSRYGKGKKRYLMLGMNPGPWGMAQTGVPFGEIGLVRDWLGLAAKVGKPENEHPKRIVQGFDCTRSEVSGARLWGWAKECFGTPDKFFESFMVVNYCPLVFMEESGKNRTPDKLPAGEIRPVNEACDWALVELARYYKPEWVIGVGAYAEKKAATVLGDMDIKVGRILHPSPASPVANRGWAPAAQKQLEDLGVALP